jgi:hypothetical protein
MTPTNHPAPAPESEREAIARIIHPEAFDGTLSGHPDNWEDKMAALENQAEAQLVALAKADAILSRMGGEPVAGQYEFPYQRTFDAIAAATDVLSGPPNQKQLSISVKKFQKAFNSHRDAPTSPPAPALDPACMQAVATTDAAKLADELNACKDQHPDLVKVICDVLCKSKVFETGQGTCALVCMDQLGDPRKRGCWYATRVHDRVALAVLEALVPHIAALRTAAQSAVRERTIEECAKVAEQLADKPGWSPNYKNAAHKIAELIRSLAQTGVKR